MKRPTCPYLGLKDDPTTALSFPSPGNYCHHARPLTPVKGSYQDQYCLTPNHTACPIYQAVQPVPLPAALASSSPKRIQGRQIMALLGIPVVLAGIALLVMAWNTFGSRLLAANNIPNTGVSNRPSVLFGALLEDTRTPFEAVVNPTTAPTRADCPLPNNWVTYTVNPTDSLFRLSVIYGVTVEDLQSANCMGNETVLLPGQVIYVPYIPTNTPMITDTLAPQAVLPTNTRQAGVVLPTDTSTPRPPGATGTSTSTVQASNTPVPGTNTPLPTITLAPSNTSQPSSTSVIPTNTSLPTLTQAPPTNTPVIPTDTPRPTRTRRPRSTNTPVPPTSTLQPPAPTDTQPPPPPPATNTPQPLAPTDTQPPPPPTDTQPPPPPPPTDTPQPPAPTDTQPPPPPPPPSATSPPPALTDTQPPPPPPPIDTLQPPPAPSDTAQPPAPTSTL